ncbi:glycosyltransferase family 4 protein [Rhizobium ruizarguesonis]|jgi:glycosyltransferase involved in cell wall biosynthesis|uniref:glycosyltransferase family 4 protein n=1 Tax=Rhizobium ruizarguesonis TaxID=2081791 RepID=UPI001030F7B2|nr:glycosyltransferase family 4 protein [Rhizobium ruizarguesonis]TAU25149.1 glycosyltransferase WbuB [Rhizobium ruizarguesonis]TAU66792.1 glycosyltransferase WbuB [Rhizobium ruizarguesonis]TAW08543.1 glycosyltransferase WbuB [Rhizobium ruizarguesonis]TAY77927.1 glycosyltransferase WbuB [Rhizobium ruizarguesonis]TAZ76778.1 glycosyltransferase WbuB [Rhizobium ruizarguesonis]
MKILVWSQYFWPENFPINELASELAEAGVKVTVLTGKPNYPEGKLFPGYRASGITRERFSNMELVRIPLVPRGAATSLRLSLNYLSFVVSGLLIAPFALRRRKFDGIFIYAPSPLLQALPALFLAYIKKVPVTLWVQDLWPDALKATGHVKNHFALRLIGILVRYIYRRSDLILVQSEAFRTPVVRGGGAPSKIRYFPNSIKAEAPIPVATDAAQKLVFEMQGTFSVIYAGNIGRAQSVETIVEAAKQLLCTAPNVKIFLVGSGSREKWMDAEIRRLGLSNLILTGRFEPSDMPSILGSASALLITLVDDPAIALTIPSKIQTFLANGRPIVASINGEGARVLSEAESGPVCPAGDGRSLAAAISQLEHMSPATREQLGKNGRQYFLEHFELTRRSRELIQHLIQAKRTGER